MTVEHPRQAAPLRAFLRWLIAGCIAFGSAELLLYVFFPAWNLLALAGSQLTLGIACAVASRWVGTARGSHTAVQVVGYGLLLYALSMSVIVPESAALIPLVPLLGISCAMAWLDRRESMVLVACSGLVAAVSVGIATALEARSTFPPALDVPLLLTGAPVLLVLNALALMHATARVRAALENERALSRRFQALAYASSHIVWTTDPHGRIVEDSPGWREFTGQSLEEFVGSGWQDAVHPDDRARAKEAWERAVSTGALYTCEYRVRRPDGSYTPCAARGAPVRADDGTVREWVGTTIDVTALKDAEAAREAVRQRDADAMRLREQFLAIASHELRTPITPLKLQLERLAQMLDRGGELANPRTVRDRVGRSLQQVRRIEELVESLLDVTQMIGGGVQMQVGQVDLAELTKHVVEHFGRSDDRAQAQLRVAVSGPVVVEGDARRIEQVVTSLVSNAVKFGAGEEIFVSVEARQGEARLEVRDQGVGIPEDLQPRLFDRFQRGEDMRYAGFGLGLYSSREIVRMHGGRIEVESAPGKGSTFVVTLPLRMALTSSTAAG